jgi:glycosyltransferase involved in cell wall biosynthesis
VQGFYVEEEAERCVRFHAAPRWRHPSSRSLDRVKRMQHLIAMRCGVTDSDFFAVSSAPVISAVRRLASGADAALVEFGQMAPCAPLGIPSVLVAYDLTWMKTAAEGRRSSRAAGSRLEKWRLGAEAVALERLETSYFARFDEIIVVSQPDADALSRALQRAEVRSLPRVTVSPNGVDWDAYGQVAERGEPGTAAFVGGLTHPPNAEAIEMLLRDVRPRVGELSKLVLAGPETDRIKAPGVIGLGTVPDIRSVYERVSFSVAPIRWGSGSRLKIIESLAARRPAVALRAAAEGLEALERSEGLIIADTDEQFAEAVRYLAADPVEASRRGEAGRQAVARYDWSIALAPVVEALSRVAGGKCSASIH